MKITRKHCVVGAAGAAAVVGIAVAAHAGIGASGASVAGGDGIAITAPGVASTLSRSGCGQLLTKAPAGSPLTVLLVSRTGAMAGAGIPDAVSRALVAAAGGAGKPVGAVTVVTVGGRGEQPRTIANAASLMDPRAGTARHDRIAAGLSGCLTKLLAAAPLPQKVGSDELRAEQLAGQAAQAAIQAGSTVRIFAIGDGEANTGLLDLRAQGFGVQPPAAAVRRVEAQRQLPDFSRVAVTYVGLGQDLDGRGRSWLTAFWSKLCRSAGGTCAVSADQVPLADPRGTVPADPAVSAISAIPGASTRFEVNAAAFEADSTRLVAPALVRSELQVVRQALASRPSALAEIVGHVCDDGSPQAGLIRLSRQRAEAIARLLGVPSGRVHVSGVGAAEPPANTGGMSADEACAAARRVDVLIR